MTGTIGRTSLPHLPHGAELPDAAETGGENVSSLRVEAVLHQHPDVAKAVVFAQALPETVGGKVLKYRLRATHADLYS